MYVFKMKKVIGVCPWGYPTDEICVYFSWKESYGQHGNEINDAKGGEASGYHGHVKLKKTIELLSITIPFHLHHNTCQICTGLAHTTTDIT